METTYGTTRTRRRLIGKLHESARPRRGSFAIERAIHLRKQIGRNLSTVFSQILRHVLDQLVRGAIAFGCCTNMDTGPKVHELSGRVPDGEQGVAPPVHEHRLREVRRENPEMQVRMARPSLPGVHSKLLYQHVRR